MKNCAVICEYNPFHTGHLYQLNKIQKKYDNVICLMSGNFVQRAEPAIIEKSVRAAVAMNCGASMVIELPIIYAVANGEMFAYGAVKTLSKLSDVDALAMGCETDDTKSLEKIAELRTTESPEFQSIIAELLDKGYSYAAALTEATAVEAEKYGISVSATKAILSEPNNLLCIEYVKAINKLGLNIKPHFIKRQGNSYNSISAMGNYLSATAIRKLLLEKRFTEATPYLTNEADVALDEFNAHFPDYTIYDLNRNRIVYWEHFGMIDNPEYANKCVEKYRKYILSGINPFVTFETAIKPLSIDLIKKIAWNFSLDNYHDQ